MLATEPREDGRSEVGVTHRDAAAGADDVGAASSAPARRAASSSGSSRATPSESSRGRVGASRQQEVGVRVAQLPGGGADSGATTSSPVVSTATRGARTTSTARCPGWRASASAAGAEPGAGREEPDRQARRSLPGGESRRPPAALRRSAPRPSPAGSVSSMPTTRSAPAGIGAPVLIRNAAPAGEPGARRVARRRRCRPTAQLARPARPRCRARSRRAPRRRGRAGRSRRRAARRARGRALRAAAAARRRAAARRGARSAARRPRP